MFTNKAMIGLNFYVEPIKSETYWIGITMTLPEKAHIVEEATAVIIEDAVVREQIIETKSDSQHPEQVNILLNVYTKQSNLRGYIKTVVCEESCKPERVEFDLDLKGSPHFHHKKWMITSSSSVWSAFVFMLMILGGIFLIGLVAFLVTMGIMFGLYLFVLVAGLYVAVFVLLAMAGAVHNIYDFCAHYWKYECCFKSKPVEAPKEEIKI